MSDYNDEVVEFFNDPLGYVLYAFDWGGDNLKGYSGPDEWQVDALSNIRDGILMGEDIGTATRLAVSSGHGVGKSALVAWIILWFMSTRTNPQIVVTANTQGQLKTKTWRELSKWHKLAINKGWFMWTATRFYLKESPETWVASAIPWSETNSEAFAGTHEDNVLVIYDEASAIPDVIWEVTEGAMTTHGAVWIAFGNPTRNSGRFFNCFHDIKNRWGTMSVDSRTAMMTNKVQIQEWVDDYGEDSDFVRVRVRGVFPRAGSVQYISSDIASNGLSYVAEGYDSEPLLMGVDIARFGGDKTVITFRQGRKVFTQLKYLGLDTMEVAEKVCSLINERSPQGVFIDGGGLGAGVCDRLNQLGFNCIEVNMGGNSSDSDRDSNKRAECWRLMKEYLEAGCDLPDDNDLQNELTTPEYMYDPKNRLVIESKRDMRRRGVPSPDSADSLSFTFAQKMYSQTKRRRKRRVSSWLTV